METTLLSLFINSSRLYIRGSALVIQHGTKCNLNCHFGIIEGGGEFGPIWDLIHK